MVSADKIQELIADTQSAIAEYEELTELEATELRKWADELERQLVAARSQESLRRQAETVAMMAEIAGGQ